VDFPATLPVKKLWSANVGGGKKQMLLRLGLGPALDQGNVFAASNKGEVLAVTLESGRHLWEKNLKLPLSAGPVAGAGIVVVGSSKGHVDRARRGHRPVLWRVRVNSELLSAPAIGERVVVLRSVDGRLRGLDLQSGKEMWSVEQQVPRLSLRGTATPVISHGMSRSAASTTARSWPSRWPTAIRSGTRPCPRRTAAPSSSAWSTSTRRCGWSATMSMRSDSRGVPRCSRWIQGRSGGRTTCRAIAALPWTARVSTSRRPTAIVIALRQRDGSEAWHNNKIKRRSLSTPVMTSTAIVVADYQGYVHWLDKKTGALVAGTQVAKYRVTNPPVAAGDTVVVMTDAGELAAFRATPPKKP
jgi:outer membrane protein assembly factor BamB